MVGGICRQQQTKFWNISPGHECWLRNLQFEATAGAVRSIIFSPKYRTLALLDDIGILRLFREIGKEWTECWSLPHKHQDFLTEACCRSSGCKSCICCLETQSQSHWPDGICTNCSGCLKEFGIFTRRHHCCSCGCIACRSCLSFSMCSNCIVPWHPAVQVGGDSSAMDEAERRCPT